MGLTNNDFQTRNFIFDKFPASQTFSCWKIRFKTEVCSCSNFPTEAMLWIREVEMVNSVDDLKSSCSIQGIIPSPDFELLHARMKHLTNVFHLRNDRRRTFAVIAKETEVTS